MDKQQLIKLHKADFTQAYLAVQNGLGGNPLTLLMSESSVDAIEQAIDNLETMLFIANSCHAKASNESSSDDAHIDDALDKLNADLSQLTDESLKKENGTAEDDSDKTSKKKSKQKPAKAEDAADDSEQSNGSSEQ